jgi:hypothetical protein
VKLFGRRRRITTLAIAVLAAVLFAGCGSSGGGGTSKAAYEKQVSDIVTKGDAKLHQLNFAKKGIGEAATDVTAMADQLAKVTPPADVKDEHARYVAAVRTLATDLTTLAADLKSFDSGSTEADAAQKLQTDASKLKADASKVNDVKQAFDAKGYKFKSVTAPSGG